MMTRLARKAAAALILGTFAGAIVEAHAYDGKMWRAPLTGAAVMGTVAALAWAEDELKGKHDGDPS
jgi:hypothetical protein